MGLQMSKTFPQILCLQVSIPHYSLALFSSFICMCTTFAKTNLHSNRPLIRYWSYFLHTNENNVNESMYYRKET